MARFRFIHRWFAVAAAGIAISILVGGCELSNDVDLNTGRGRYRYTFFGYTVIQGHRKTTFSERFATPSTKSAMWIPVTSYTAYNWTSPHYVFHNVEFLMDMVTMASDVRGLSKEQQIPLAEHLLALLRHGQREDAEKFVHELSNSKDNTDLPTLLQRYKLTR